VEWRKQIGSFHFFTQPPHKNARIKFLSIVGYEISLFFIFLFPHAKIPDNTHPQPFSISPFEKDRFFSVFSLHKSIGEFPRIQPQPPDSDIQIACF
jgi:hypothetical protein